MDTELDGGSGLQRPGRHGLITLLLSSQECFATTTLWCRPSYPKQTDLQICQAGAYADGVMGVSEHPLSSPQHPVTPQPRSDFVKHSLQNTENDCHQWLFDRFRVLHICFRPGLRPAPRWGAYNTPSHSLTSFRGPLFWGRER